MFQRTPAKFGDDWLQSTPYHHQPSPTNMVGGGSFFPYYYMERAHVRPVFPKQIEQGRWDCLGLKALDA